MGLEENNRVEVEVTWLLADTSVSSWPSKAILKIISQCRVARWGGRLSRTVRTVLKNRPMELRGQFVSHNVAGEVASVAIRAQELGCNRWWLTDRQLIYSW